jgi:hypothetical protein
MPFKNYKGSRYGKLVLRKFLYRKKKVTYWSADCDCGTKDHPVSMRNVLTGRTETCGCGVAAAASNRAKHRMCGTPTYRVWSAMLQRCKNDPNYVEKGITVCERWANKKNGFQNFLADMGERPDGLTIERKRNGEGYRPGNCVWATRADQNKNRSVNRMLTIGDRTMCAADWARERGLAPRTVHNRLRAGDDPETALRPVAGRRRDEPDSVVAACDQSIGTFT